MVVEIRPEDLQNDELRMKNEELGFADDTDSVLSMMHFQEALEAACWQQGNMRQTAPAQRMVDFTRKKLSYDLPESSYSPGLVSSPLHFWMPPFIANRLSKGFQQFGKTSHGFLTNDAVLIGVETRTSSPVRIVRAMRPCNTSRCRDCFLAEKGQDMQAVSYLQALTVSDVPKRWQLTSDSLSRKTVFSFIIKMKKTYQY